MTADYGRSRRKQSATALWWLIGISAVGAVIIGVYLFLGDEDLVSGYGATIDEIVDTPAAYVGETVTVSGEVNEVLAPFALQMGGEAAAESLLVVMAEPVAAPSGRPPDSPIFERDVIQVSGTVRTFDISEIEGEAGVELDEELFAEYEAEPVLIARAVDFEVLGEPAGQDLAIARIVADPAAYEGDVGTISGEISEVLDENAFVLSDETLPGGRGLLVLGAEPIGDVLRGIDETDLDVNAAVEVTGTVRVFDRNELQDEMDYALDASVYEGWEGEAVMIATEIEGAPPE